MHLQSCGAGFAEHPRPDHNGTHLKAGDGDVYAETRLPELLEQLETFQTRALTGRPDAYRKAAGLGRAVGRSP
jgi:hypothetical protein